MTLAEYSELFFLNQELVATHAMNYSAMVFAYLLAGHVVGAVLTKTQVFIISILYTGFLLGPFFQYLAAFNARHLLGMKIESLSVDVFRTIYPNAFPFSHQAGLAIAMSIFVGGWAASILYMVHARRNAVERVT